MSLWMQSISLSLASMNLGCSHPRFSSRSSLVMVGKNCIASKNGPSCSTMPWIVTLPILIPVDQVNLLPEHDPEKWVSVFQKARHRARPEGSCSNKKLKRDDDSKKSHHALGPAVAI